MATNVIIRPPTFSKAVAPKEFQQPSIPWLMEEWHVTHSTLDMWKTLRNVQIKYTALDPSSADISKANTDRVDDLVTYQKLDSDKIQAIHGLDKAANAGTRGEWDWRGHGWLRVASSHWEILGWGEEAGTGTKYVVTVFAKTMFSPAGLDIYSKDRNGLKAETIEAIKAGLAALDDESTTTMARDLFEVKIDDARKVE